MPMQFEDRRQAGRFLARRLSRYAGRRDVIVLALPRGGAPVAFEVARELEAPLDVLLVRKLGVPGFEEAAMGAVAEDDIRLVNPVLVHALGIDSETVESLIRGEEAELERRKRAYRGARPPLEVAGRTVIVVDDGLATGSTMLAAVSALRERHPSAIVVAVPVAAPSTCAALARHVDDLVCAYTPEPFRAVGLWYANFEQTGDEEVREVLERAAREHAERTRRAPAEAPPEVPPRG